MHRALHPRTSFETTEFGVTYAFTDVVQDAHSYAIIAHDATAADILSPSLELRLDERDEVCVRPRRLRAATH